MYFIVAYQQISSGEKCESLTHKTIDTSHEFTNAFVKKTQRYGFEAYFIYEIMKLTGALLVKLHYWLASRR